MFKVLLVDDEALTRDAISKRIHWEEIGFLLIGTCANGKEAMEAIEKEQPDLLLTDICMPYVDGLELARHVYENYPEMKTIIISGYDEFEYAKTAVKYHVSEYVLKPVTAAELTEILERVKKELEEEARKEEGIRKIKGAYLSNLPVLRGRFLNSMIHGNLPENEIMEKSEEYGICLHGKYYAVCLLEALKLDGFVKEYKETQHHLALFAMFNIAEEIMNDEQAGIAFQYVDDRTILIFSAENQELLLETIRTVCEKINEAIKKFLQIETMIGVGLSVNTLGRIRISYKSAQSALEYRFLAEGDNVLFAKDFEKPGKETPFDSSTFTAQILLSVKVNHMEEVQKQVHEFIQNLRERKLSKNNNILHIQGMVLSLVNAVRDSGLADESVYEEQKKLLSEIYERNHLSEIEEDLVGFCKQLTNSMSAQRDCYGKKQSIKALDYIEKHYMESDLSLNSVCNYLAMSTSYFSSVFKNYTGETFIEALSRIRIEKAKQLILNTSLKTYEIAEQVGFADPHYFSSTFKKITGYTPREYRKEKDDNTV